MTTFPKSEKGGDVVEDGRSPYHATLTGLTPEQVVTAYTTVQILEGASKMNQKSFSQTSTTQIQKEGWVDVPERCYIKRQKNRASDGISYSLYEELGLRIVH